MIRAALNTTWFFCMSQKMWFVHIRIKSGDMPQIACKACMLLDFSILSFRMGVGFSSCLFAEGQLFCTKRACSLPGQRWGPFWLIW